MTLENEVPSVDYKASLDAAKFRIASLEAEKKGLEERVRELEDAIETAETQHGLETESTNYIFKRCDELRATNDTLTCALAEAREALQELFSVASPQIMYLSGLKPHRVLREAEQVLKDPTSQRASEEMKGLRKVVEEAKKVTNIASPIYGCDLRGLKDALEAYESRGEV